MVGNLFNNDNTITFFEDTHTYLHGKEQYKSVSKVLNGLEIPFDREGISLRMAKGDKTRQAEILAEWDKKRDDSLDKGNWIHDNLEKYILYGEYDPRLEPVVMMLAPMLKEGYRYYSEALIYSHKYKTAGQTDLVIQRQKSQNSVFDFWDYKTNQSKGIQFDSINRKKDPWKHYNKFFLPPLDHLEDCNYNRYSLQLSLYAFMAEDTWGIKVGKLGIIFIDNDLVMHRYPVPYMKFEARELLLEANQVTKILPKVQDEDDW